jgi:hypothetical protein
MLVLAGVADAYPDDADATVRYRLPTRLQPLAAANGTPQAVLTRGDGGGLLHLRLGAVWPELGPGERPVPFAAGRFRLLLQTPAARETGQWHPTPIAGSTVVDRSISLTAPEVAIARRLGQATQDLVDVEVELEVRGFAPTFPWLASAASETLGSRIRALLGPSPAQWDAVEAAFLGLTEDTFAWQPLAPGAIRAPRDAALIAIAHHAAPVLLASTANGWTVASDAPARLDVNLAVPVVQTRSVGLRWSFSEFLSRQADPSRHLVDVAAPAPFAAGELCIVNDVPLAANGVRSVVVEARTGGPTGLLSHEFRPAEPSAARLRFVRETAEDLNVEWRARCTVVTSSGPTALPPTPFRKSGPMIEVTPAALGLTPLRLSAEPVVFEHATSLEVTIGSRTLELTRTSPEAWAIGRDPPPSATVAARLASGQRQSLGAMPLDSLGLTIDAAALGCGAVSSVVVRPPADLSTRAAYLAVQVEGHGWRTLDGNAELTLPVRRVSRLEPPAIRYRTRHVPRDPGGSTRAISESGWRQAAGDIISVEL